MHEIHLSENAKAYVEGRLVDGDYGDASAFIETLVREDQTLREDLMNTVAKRREELEAKMLEGLSSGEPIPVDAEFWAEQRRRLANETAGP